MAFFELMFRERMAVSNRAQLAANLQGIGRTAARVPGGGGDWNRATKRRSIDAVKGVIRSCFEKVEAPEDYSSYGWTSHLEVLLGNAVIEQQLFDCKQGFLSLGQSRNFDESSFKKICRTLCAMANQGPGTVGHIAIGIVDSASDAIRVAQLDGTTAVEYKGFNIVGVEREAVVERKSPNDYYTWLVQKLRTTPLLDSTLAVTVASESRAVNYHGRMVILLRVVGQDQPFFFEGSLFERVGSETVEVPQSDYMRIYQRFTRAT